MAIYGRRYDKITFIFMYVSHVFFVWEPGLRNKCICRPDILLEMVVVAAAVVMLLQKKKQIFFILHSITNVKLKGFWLQFSWYFVSCIVIFLFCVHIEKKKTRRFYVSTLFLRALATTLRLLFCHVDVSESLF